MLPVGNGRESLQRESGREALITQPHSGAGVRFDHPTFSRKYCSAPQETLVQRNMVFITQILILEYSLQEVVVVTNVDVFSQRFVARGNQSPRTANARVAGTVSGRLGVAQAAEQVVERALVAIDVHGGRHHGAQATALDLAVARSIS